MWRLRCLRTGAVLLGSCYIFFLVFYFYGDSLLVRVTHHASCSRVGSTSHYHIHSSSSDTPSATGRGLLRRGTGAEESRTTEFPINVPGICDLDLFLLILVHSLPPSDMQRNAVRTTYGKNLTQVLGRKVRVVFFCPSTSPAETIAGKMLNESLENNDLVHSSVADSPRASRPSPRAMLSEFRWVKTYCASAKFILFANDEQFVNVEVLLRKMKQRENVGYLENFYLGRVKEGAKPNRSPEHREYVPESAFPGSRYPKFCIAGAGMVLSNAFIRNVYDSAVQFHSEVLKFPMGDILLGVVVNKLNMTPMHDSKFRENSGYMVYCELNDVLVSGGFDTPSGLTDAWANIPSKKMAVCPNPVPNATEVEKWTRGVDNGLYFEDVFRLIHNPRGSCSDEKGDNETLLLALVSTHPDNGARRDAIRQTWADPPYQHRHGVKTLFVLARTGIETPDKVAELRNESEEHNDLIQADFIEAYPNLTLKVILGLRWVIKYCPGVPFVYKGDDDMLVNFESITAHLRALPLEDARELFLGQRMVHSAVIRNGWKYKTTRAQYPFKYYLPYFSGGGYIMSQRAVREMNQKAQTTKLIPIDDAYAGILAFRAGIPLRHSNGFAVFSGRGDIDKYRCRFTELYNIHGFSDPTVMTSTWKTFTRTNGTCDGR